MRQEVETFLLELVAMEASRNATAVLRSIGEGSDAQEFRFALAATGPAATLLLSVDVVKVRFRRGGYVINRCSLSYEVDQGDLLQLLHQAQELFSSTAPE